LLRAKNDVGDGPKKMRRENGRWRARKGGGNWGQGGGETLLAEISGEPEPKRQEKATAGSPQGSRFAQKKTSGGEDGARKVGRTSSGRDL